MQNHTLEYWLSHINSLHPQEIVLGLERVKTVARRLNPDKPPCPVIIVGGTNGKGSCVASLEKIYQAQGYRTGAFTSPILFRHQELLRIQGREAEDSLFCQAYEKIEKCRAEVSLTPFEYHTLAVLDILRQESLDVWILEVGLGGRLDAVNVIDADLSIVTSIGIDHVEWLGHSRESIGFEKAGIFRPKRPAVCGDFDPPQSLQAHAEKIGAAFYCQNRDFSYTEDAASWNWRGQKSRYQELPYFQLAPQNISTALMAVELLQSALPVSESAVRQAIATLSLPGRIEIRPGRITEIHDVAHNPAAAAFLANRLKQLPSSGKTRAVFSMLADKDIAGSLREMKPKVDEWHVAPLTVKRGASLEQLRAAFQSEEIASVFFYESLPQAASAARHASHENDRLLVFGSFYTVATDLTSVF